MLLYRAPMNSVAPQVRTPSMLNAPWRHSVSRLTRVFLFVGVAAWCSAVAADAPVGEPHVYKRVGERALSLYVLSPANSQLKAPKPAIVFFHGGGWVGGAPNQFNEHARYFASRGLVCVQVEYRLLSGAGTPPDVCIQDARSAMRWVRSHAAEFAIDPQRIAAAGGSAGGHLAAHVGMVADGDDPKDDSAVSPRANAMILFNPVLDNGPGSWGANRVGARVRELSPAHNISADDPPAIVFLGTADKLIPVATLEKFQAGMKAAGVRCELRLYEGQGHGFFNARNAGGEYYTRTVIEADKFLASLGWLTGAPTLTRPTQTPKTPAAP